MKKKQGFAAIPMKLRRSISKLGAKAAHEAGTAHRFTPEEARLAGLKGAEARRRKKAGAGQMELKPEAQQ